MHEHDRAAEPAAERQEREPDQRQDERPRVDRAVRVAGVADERGDQEEDVAVSIEHMCQVAVHQIGERHSIVEPVGEAGSAVRLVISRPTTSASHQACAAVTWATPITLANAVIVAAV